MLLNDQIHTLYILSYLFYFKLIYLNWRLITLQYCGGFLPHTDMSQPWVYMCPPS